MRYETVGSFLPPIEVVNARAEHKAGRLSDTHLHEIEDIAVRDIADRQLAAGLKTVTPGEMRRKSWDKDFYFGLGGIIPEHIDNGHLYQAVESFTDLVRIDGPITYNPYHPFFSGNKFFNDYIDRRAIVRQTIPSPANLYIELLDEESDYYNDKTKLIADIATAYNQTIRRFYEIGCRSIQLDDTAVARLADHAFVTQLVMGGINPAEIRNDIINVINTAVADLPEDMEVSVYISGGEHVIPNWNGLPDTPDSISSILPKLNVGTYFLPFDVRDPETLAALAGIPDGRRVVLGVISAHTPYPDDEAAVRATVRAAEKYISPDHLAISPVCGFKLTHFTTKGLVYEDQWRKVAELARIAGSL